MSDIVKNILTPLDEPVVRSLRAGDRVLLSGTVYTARDAAHRRIVETIRGGGEPPFPLEGAVIFYAGPAPARPGSVIGPIGPTTSGRMDSYTPLLFERGLRGTIGKGSRSPEVLEAMTRFGCVYFGATGGVASLMARCVTRVDSVAYDDLGAEAVRRLDVRDMPLVVAADCFGGDMYSRRPSAR